MRGASAPRFASDAEARAAIVAEALSWEGTKYHAHARVKGVGVDCAQLPAAVYEAVGLAPHVAPNYSSDWMLHRDEELYLAHVLPHAREITREESGPGDLVMWKFGRTFSHSAIIIDLPVVIHAVLRGGAVIRADIDQDADLVSRPARFFTVLGAR